MTPWRWWLHGERLISETIRQLPDTVLSEVMGMSPGVIKQEVEDVAEISCDIRASIGEIADMSDISIGAEVVYGDMVDDNQDCGDNVDPLSKSLTPPYPQLEGKEEEESPNSPPVTAYLSMDNARNYVCNNGDFLLVFLVSSTSKESAYKNIN